MKNLLVLAVLGVGGWFAYTKLYKGGGPPVIEHPVYGEIRVDASVQNREIQMALFIRSAGELDCRTRARESWTQGLRGCPSCVLQAVQCHDTLPPRYAKLFDDVPIPSVYLSATAAAYDERDGRLVVYGLTDAEGMQVCEVLRGQLAERYKGATRCIPPSGG